MRGGSLNNTAGAITARDGDMRLESDKLTNAAQNGIGALVASGGNLVIVAPRVDNTADGAVKSMLWSGKDLKLEAELLSNSGAIEAVHSARLTVGQILSTGGSMAANKELRVETANYDNNDTLQADDFTFVGQTFNNHAGATIKTTGSLGVDAKQSVVNDGSLVANQTLTITSADLVNHGAIRANDLSLKTTGTITNSANGEISADRSMALHSATLQNSGLINSNGLNGTSLVRIDAQTVNNTGTGAIYGDNVQIQTGTLNNQPGGSASAPIIAARNRLAIGATSLNNLDGATLYSLGDMAIGTDVDAHGTVTGKTRVLNNISATIEAKNNLAVGADTLLNERRNVQITTSKVLDDNRTMQAPAWWHNGANGGGGGSGGPNSNTANYNPLVAYYVDPSAILKDEIIITPDGYQVHRAEVNLSTKDSAFFFAWGSYAGHVGDRSRYPVSANGTTVIYYRTRSDGQSNPDQVAGAPGAFAAYTGGITTWEVDTLAYSKAYGQCTTNCVRLLATFEYVDPYNVIGRDTFRPHPTSTSGNEVQRIAHHTATEIQLGAGAGSYAQILSGGAMNIDIGSSLTNRYGQIAAGGNLTINGQGGDPLTNSKVTNIGQTLTRTHTFANTTVQANGGTSGWTKLDIVETIGSVGSGITSGGALTIKAHDIRNTDLANAGPASVKGVTFSDMRAQSGGTGYVFEVPAGSLYTINPGGSRPTAGGPTNPNGPTDTKATQGSDARGIANGGTDSNKTTKADEANGESAQDVARDSVTKTGSTHANATGVAAADTSGKSASSQNAPSAAANGASADSARGNGASQSGATGAMANGASANAAKGNGASQSGTIGAAANGASTGAATGNGASQSGTTGAAANGASAGAATGNGASQSGATGATANGASASAATGTGANQSSAGGSANGLGPQGFNGVVKPGLTTPGMYNANLQLAPTALNGNQPLVSTDTRLIGNGPYQSSDAQLTALGYNVNNVLKRLGDGFYEQQLVKNQVLQLTGQRYLSGYTSDEAEYAALLNAGVAFANKYQLALGVGVSASQMALLTSDIVWLVEQTITLPDGTRQKVLAPVVYQAVRSGNLSVTGALLGGNTITLNLTGNVVNSGNINGQSVTSITAGGDISNLGGRITGGQAVGLYAGHDILNLGGTVSAGSVLVANAGHDLVVSTTVLSDAGEAATLAWVPW